MKRLTLALLSILLILSTTTKTEEINQKINQRAQEQEDPLPKDPQNLCGKDCVSCETAEDGSFYCSLCYQTALSNGQCQETKTSTTVRSSTPTGARCALRASEWTPERPISQSSAEPSQMSPRTLSSPFSTKSLQQGTKSLPARAGT